MSVSCVCLKSCLACCCCCLLGYSISPLYFSNTISATEKVQVCAASACVGKAPADGACTCINQNVQALETANALHAVDSESTQKELADAQNPAACRVIEDLAAAIVHLVEQHYVVSRYMLHDAQYQLAATERRCLHIHCLPMLMLTGIVIHKSLHGFEAPATTCKERVCTPTVSCKTMCSTWKIGIMCLERFAKSAMMQTCGWLQTYSRLPFRCLGCSFRGTLLAIFLV